MVVYSALSLVFPAKETFVSEEEMEEQRAELELEGERRDQESVGSTEKDDKRGIP